MQAQSLQQSIDAVPIREITGFRAFQWLSRLTPSDHGLFSLLRPFVPERGLVSVPFAGSRVLRPAAWVGAYTANFLFDLERVYPECHLFQAALTGAGSGTVVDVGANLGIYTLLAREMTSAPVIAYEPSPLTCCILNRTLDMNGVQGVDVRPMACGDTPGRVGLQDNINSYVCPAAAADSPDCSDFEQLCRRMQDDSMVVDVAQVTLDEELAGERDIALIKIDAEGYEHRILLGARTVLANKRPTLFIELHPWLIQQVGHSTSEELCGLLRELAYDIECWNFHRMRFVGRARGLLSRYRSNPGHRYRDVADMLADTRRIPVQQVYLVATPAERT